MTEGDMLLILPALLGLVVVFGLVDHCLLNRRDRQRQR